MKIGECFRSSTSSHDDIKESGARALVLSVQWRQGSFGHSMQK